MKSAWQSINDKVFKVITPTAASFGLVGVNTSSLEDFPDTGGAGSFRKIIDWKPFAEVLNASGEGGEQQYVDYQLLNDKTSQQRRLPTFKNATGLTITIPDDPDDAGRKVADQADADTLPRAVRAVLPNKVVILYNAYVSVNSTPKMDANEIMTVEVKLALLSKPVRY
ncbi:phage tail protein [Solimicrobium silvestre]|uniref:phage tail protein n=1 Tax=Solimicrobium silvestre TaxID=2099400 RepID=UPI000CFE07E4|nr:phage tail protein [Solimicrobium silvestre]